MMILLPILLLSSLTFAASEPVGYYSAGTLKNAVELPVAGPGYMKLFKERNRAWGTQEMIDMIIGAGDHMNTMYPETDRMQIGDISKEEGGLLSDLHNSHQNGLDVDLTYYRVNKVEQLPTQINGFVENMVVRKRLSKNFDTARNWEFMKTLHKIARVQRIFMDPVIKKEFCRFARLNNELISQVEVLRSFRPYPNHDDHMHVRLRCPPEAVECVTQEDPPPGNGCNAI